MKPNKIFLSAPETSELEKKLLNKALESEWLAPNGPFNQKFEQELESYFNRNILLTNSGTSAIHLALIQANITQNDIVLCSNFTFGASAFPIAYQKAKPYFVDIEKETWNLSLELLEQSFQELKKGNKRPKALILTHSFGVSAEIIKIKEFCLENEIFLIEDAAEALGSTFNNQPLGTFGNAGILSFNGNKIVTTTAGGALISSNKTLIDNSRKLANQAKENAGYYLHKEIGYNYSMSNLLAAIGYAQFQNLQEKVEKRRSIFEFYKSVFKELYGNNFSYPKEIKGSFSNRWLSVFSLPKGEAKRLKSKLEENNIESRFLWNPMHKQPVFKGAEFISDGYSEYLFDNGIALPSGSGLTTKDLERIKEVILSE